MKQEFDFVGDTKTRVIAAATHLFAKKGLENVSLRQLTSLAGVNLAAVNYHFGSKEALAEAVLDAVAGSVNSRRLKKLNKVLEEAEKFGRRPSLPAIIETFLDPYLAENEEEEGAVLAQLVLKDRISRNDLTSRIIRKHFDPLGREYIAALAKACPHVHPDDFYWRYTLMYGAVILTATDRSPDNRLSTMSVGRFDAADVVSLRQHVMDFLVPAMGAPSRIPLGDRSLVQPGTAAPLAEAIRVNPNTLLLGHSQNKFKQSFDTSVRQTCASPPLVNLPELNHWQPLTLCRCIKQAFCTCERTLKARRFAMFEYFDGNYSWNLATTMVLNSGGQIAEVDDALAALKKKQGASNNDFCQAWLQAALRVDELASLDEGAGNFRAAGGKYARAAGYYFAAERQSSPSDPNRSAIYARMLTTFAKFIELRREPCRRVDVPYENGASLPALFVEGKGSAAKKPCMVHFDGLDVCKEWLYLSGMPQELAERGVSTLVVDHPGVGEALRLRGLKGVVETERAASACVDWLETTANVDPQRIGMMALSLGGYYSMRSAAFEPRFRCAVAWGAMYDFGAVARGLVADGTHKSVDHILHHLEWVTGISKTEDILAQTDRMTLNGILDRIKCPILIAHGENDRQVPLAAAKRVIAEAVNSPGRELKVHTITEGGSEHCSVDNISITTDYMAHWIARTLDAAKELA